MASIDHESDAWTHQIIRCSSLIECRLEWSSASTGVHPISTTQWGIANHQQLDCECDEHVGEPARQARVDPPSQTPGTWNLAYPIRQSWSLGVLFLPPSRDRRSTQYGARVQKHGTGCTTHVHGHAAPMASFNRELLSRTRDIY